MIRNLKALGLAMVAVFAMSAMAASAAQAEDPAFFAAPNIRRHFRNKAEPRRSAPESGNLHCQHVEGNAVLD